MATHQDDEGGAELSPDIHPETRSRLSPLRRDALSEEGRRAYDRITDPNDRLRARPDGPASIWLRVPELSAHAREINWHLRNRSSFAKSTLEIIVLATARETNARFEWFAHEPLARAAGVADTLIEVLRLRKPLDGVPEEDALLIAFVREVAGNRGVSPELYAKVLAAYGEDRLVEIVLVVANYAMTAIMLHAFDKRLPEGAESRMPDLSD